MCGIAGIISAATGADALWHAVERMSGAQRHRGPDDAGVERVAEASPAVVLGHRRLSILDLSAAGHQPMGDAASGCSLVFNGEIYNFKALRAELERAGHAFRTGTDTEVILRGYLAWGDAVASRLRGIFAFALWDPRRRAVLLVRDPLGVKPLYVHEARGQVAFASEVRALLASGLVERRLDLDAARSFLAFGSVQEPRTLVRGVRSLPPGALAWADGDTLRQARYHDLPPATDAAWPGAPNGADPGGLRERVHGALVDAVGSQLVADVPLGAFLSGGVDSSAIALLMREAGAPDVRTFNVCFTEASFDEREFARLAAGAAGATHADIELSPDEFMHRLDDAVGAFDQPSVDGINTWFVSRAVKHAGLTVALAGVGGDELFAGYRGFAKALRAERMARLARPVPRSLRRAVGRALETRATREAARQAGVLLHSRLDPYFTTRRVFGPLQSDALLRPELRDGGEEGWADDALIPLADAASGFDPVNRTSRLEMRTYMLSTLLRDTDQMSMAHSLEVRVPLIDQALVDLVLPIHGSHKISPDVPKRLLVEPLGDSLPAACVHRPKRGFTLPFAVWLRRPAGAEAVESRLGAAAAAGGPLDADAVDAVRRAFTRDPAQWSRVWALFVLADWLARHEVRA